MHKHENVEKPAYSLRKAFNYDKRFLLGSASVQHLRLFIDPGAPCTLDVVLCQLPHDSLQMLDISSGRWLFLEMALGL